MLDDFSLTESMLSEIAHPANKVIMILGGADTGKTHLIEVLADTLAKKFTAGVVDLDMGQSHIGPPTTIAWGQVKGGFKGWEAIKVKDLYFTGTLSPFGNLLPTITGAKLITDKARAACDKVLIDTTGLIAEPQGRVLKENKIDLISPELILAIQLRSELESILKSFEKVDTPKIFKLAVPKGIKQKSVQTRAKYREEKFREYFEGARSVAFSLKKVSLREVDGRAIAKGEMRGRIVSLRDKQNKDVALGVLNELDMKNKKLSVYAHPVDEDRIGSVIIGVAKYPL